MTAAVPPTLEPLGLTAVVAASLRNGIGARGSLPWRLPKDMAYFRAATSKLVDTHADDERMLRVGFPRRETAIKNAVIMGRNTWESIPARFRPLAGRINVVVSTTMHDADLGLCVDRAATNDSLAPEPDTFLVRSMDEAVARLDVRRLWRYMEPTGPGAALGHAFVIGGAALYRTVLAAPVHSGTWRLDSLLVTRIFAPRDVHTACDVFMDEFRTPAQIAWEDQLADKCVRAQAAGHTEACSLLHGPHTCPAFVDEHAPWRHVSAAEHAAFLRQVPQAAMADQLVEDNGMVVQLQLWKRRAAT